MSESPRVFVPTPAEPPKVEDFNAKLLRAFNERIQPFGQADRPSGEMPTLANVERGLTDDQALLLHTQASRWLEFAKKELSLAELKVKAAKAKAEAFKRRQAFVHKTKQFGSLEELNTYDLLLEAELEADAEASALTVVVSSLSKVIAAASRTLSTSNSSAFVR